MPLFAACTRYSLVKGERIVRYVLTAWLHGFGNEMTCLSIAAILHNFIVPVRYGTLNANMQALNSS